MTIKKLDVGKPVYAPTTLKVKISYKNPDTGVYENPVAVKLKVENPSGTLTVNTNALLPDETGKYSYNVPFNAQGTWYGTWIVLNGSEEILNDVWQIYIEKNPVDGVAGG